METRGPHPPPCASPGAAGSTNGFERAATPGSPPALEPPALTPAAPPAVTRDVLFLRGIAPALVVGLFADRVMLLLPGAVLLFDRFDEKGGGGAFAGFETDCVRREAMMVAASGRTLALSCKVVLERS